MPTQASPLPSPSLSSLNIADLESAFEARGSDREFLTLLHAELVRRSSDRAMALRLKTAGQLAGGGPRSPALPKQPRDAPQPAAEAHAMAAARPQHFDNQPAAVLAAWSALEALSPRGFWAPSDLAAGGDGKLVARLDRGALPWAGSGESAPPKKQLTYLLVLGSIDLRHALPALARRFPDERPERPHAEGRAVMAIVELDRDGRPRPSGGVAISSYAWGLARALQGELSRLPDAAAECAALQQQLSARLQRSEPPDHPLPLDADAIRQAHAWLAQALGLPESMLIAPSFAIRRHEFLRSTVPADLLALDSPHLADLATARALLQQGRAPLALRRYLGEAAATGRSAWPADAAPAARTGATTADDSTHAEPHATSHPAFDPELAALLAPANASPARWPFGTAGLAARTPAQQAAAQLALAGADGLLAIEAPPGTGKEAVLQDVLAALVTQRAEAMCAFDDPAQAFEPLGEPIELGGAALQLHTVDPRVKGYELLIASPHGKAAESLCAELCGPALAEGSSDPAKYFMPLASALAQRPAWGLIALPLATPAQRGRLAALGWRDPDLGLSSYLTHVGGKPQFVGVRDPKNSTFSRRRPISVTSGDAPPKREIALKRWLAARAGYAPRLQAVQARLAALAPLHEQLGRLPTIERAAGEAGRALEDAKLAAAGAGRALASARRGVARTEKKLAEARDAVRDHAPQKPGAAASLFRTAAAKGWDERQQALEAELASATSAQQDSEHLVEECEQAQRSAEQTVERCSGPALAAQQALQTLQAQLQATRAAVDAASGSAAGSSAPAHAVAAPAPAPEFPSSASPLSPPSPPSSPSPSQLAIDDPLTRRLRGELFVAAMALHRAFIDAAAEPLRNNLALLMQALGGQVAPEVERAQRLQDLWCSLFLVVPAVATTLGSVGRLMEGVPPESLGWLFIDDAAGEAPQVAVGALLRARRAIVAGDAQQLEPWLALPERLSEAICDQAGVDPARFSAPAASVQSRAGSASDIGAPLGAAVSEPGERSAAGLPLLWRARWARPLPALANAIAYGGQLKVGDDQGGASPIRECLGPAAWFDVVAAPAATGPASHKPERWCAEEGARVLALLQQLKQAGAQPDVCLVSPFAAVADKLRQRLRDGDLLAGWVADPARWCRERIGTPQSLQMGEAEAVILVLGAQAPAHAAERAWAGSRPRLLNGALGHAREVFYVVGHRALWRGEGSFAGLDAGLA